MKQNKEKFNVIGKVNVKYDKQKSGYIIFFAQDFTINWPVN